MEIFENEISLTKESNSLVSTPLIDRAVLENLVLEAVSKLMKEEPLLYDIGTLGTDNKNTQVHEQALSHRIAFYIETSQIFKNLLIIFNNANVYVDCEYNKNGLKDKTAIFNKTDFDKAVSNCNCSDCNKRKYADKKRIRPDIVIHKRVSNVNLLAVELKKNTVCEFDRLKLTYFTSKIKDEGYGYELGVYIIINGGEPYYYCFIDGKEGEKNILN